MIGYSTDSLEMRVLRNVTTLKQLCKLLLFVYSLKDWMILLCHFHSFGKREDTKILRRPESKGANIC